MVTTHIKLTLQRTYGAFQVSDQGHKTTATLVVACIVKPRHHSDQRYSTILFIRRFSWYDKSDMVVALMSRITLITQLSKHMEIEPVNRSYHQLELDLHIYEQKGNIGKDQQNGRHCPDLNRGSPVYQTGALTAKPQRRTLMGKKNMVGWPKKSFIENWLNHREKDVFTSFRYLK